MLFPFREGSGGSLKVDPDLLKSNEVGLLLD